MEGENSENQNQMEGCPRTPYHLENGLCNKSQLEKLGEIEVSRSGRGKALLEKITEWLMSGGDVGDLIKDFALQEGIEENSKLLKNIPAIMSEIIPHRLYVSRYVHWEHTRAEIVEGKFVYVATERLSKEDAVEVLSKWMFAPLRSCMKINAMPIDTNTSAATSEAEEASSVEQDSAQKEDLANTKIEQKET